MSSEVSASDAQPKEGHDAADALPGSTGDSIGGSAAAIMDSLPFYVMLVDEKHNIVYANSTIRKTTGLSIHEITGKYCPRLIHNLDGPYPGCPVEEAVATNLPVEKVFYNEDISRWVKSTAYPVDLYTREGHRIYFHMTFDVNEEIKAKTDIEKEYDKQKILSSIIELSLKNTLVEDILKFALDKVLALKWLSLHGTGAIFLVDEENPDTLLMKGQHGLSEVIIKSCSRVPFGNCMCGRAALTQKVQFSNTLDDRHDVRYADMKPHGHYCVPIVSEASTLGVINVYVKEGHTHNESEEAFLQAVANTLAAIIVHRNAEKEKTIAQEQLLQAQKMEAIGNLAGGVAHDFNNLLTVMKGLAQLSLGSIDATHPLYTNLQEILSASNRAADLTRQMLVFSRKQISKPEKIDPNEAIQSMLKMLQRLLGEDVTVHIQFEDRPWIIDIDPGSLNQIVMNLAVNARDAMPEGGALTFKTENVLISKERTLRHWDVKTGRYVCISVQDTGTGIDAETLKRLFEPFFTTKAEGKGTGLGLSVVYGAVKKAGGWIDIATQKNKGTAFKVYFPAVKGKTETRIRKKIDRPIPKGNGENILVVEDEDSVRMVTRAILAENGYAVEEARSFTEAVSTYTQMKDTIDMVFTDTILPDGNGIQLIQRLKEINPKLKTLLSSGYSSDKFQSEFQNLESVCFITKPYDLEELLRTVRDILVSV